MDKLNVECYYVRGVTTDSEGKGGESKGSSHAWNKVKIDGKYYNIDLTWDDPTSSRVEQQESVSGIENYLYFLRSDEFFNKERTPNTFKDLKAENDYVGRPIGDLKDPTLDLDTLLEESKLKIDELLEKSREELDELMNRSSRRLEEAS